MKSKLVRDKIPDIISRSGRIPNIRKLNDNEYFKALVEKIHEEADEFNVTNSIDELADILEVLYAIMAYKSYLLDSVENVRMKKRESNGGFEQRIFLESIMDGGHND